MISAASLPPVSLLKTPVDTFVSQVISDHNGENLLVKVLDGREMEDWRGVFKSFAEAFCFPDYFGNNLNAFIECLGDLEWLPAGGYVVVLDSAERLLVGLPPEDTKFFIDLLTTDVVEFWSDPMNHGEMRDHPSKPFRFLLHQSEMTGQPLHPAIASLPTVPT